MAKFKYEIIEKIGALSEAKKGWQKQLNLIAWHGHEPKLDIRKWSEDGSLMAKGITLSNDEAIKLRKLLVERELK